MRVLRTPYSVLCALCSAQEFVKDPRFVVGDANRFDVEQGALGVFSAAAFLAKCFVLIR